MAHLIVFLVEQVSLSVENVSAVFAWFVMTYYSNNMGLLNSRSCA